VNRAIPVTLHEAPPALAPAMEAQPQPAVLHVHWPEYLIELGGLAWVMLAAGTIAAVLWYPNSPVDHAVRPEPLRRFVMVSGSRAP
jgi:hypothetical protein